MRLAKLAQLIRRGARFKPSLAPTSMFLTLHGIKFLKLPGQRRVKRRQSSKQRGEQKQSL